MTARISLRLVPALPTRSMCAEMPDIEVTFDDLPLIEDGWTEEEIKNAKRYQAFLRRVDWSHLPGAAQ